MTKKEMQDKIEDEIIVDCYDEYEVNLGWFTFFGDELGFPFEAEVLIKNRKGTKKLEKVDVLRIADNDFESEGICFEISIKKSDMVFEVPISKLKNIEAGEDEATQEAFEIWKFWKTEM
ncbi:MAG: calcium-binding protein [Saprospiraceae bacterium]